MSCKLHASPEAFDRELKKAARVNQSLAKASVTMMAIATRRPRRSMADMPGPPPPPHVRIGRNAPCPCGSGKKFKRCCRRFVV